MGVLNDNIRMGASAAGAYEIERSLRFPGGDPGPNMHYTPSSTGNRKKFTISFWTKRWNAGNNADYAVTSQSPISAYAGDGSSHGGYGTDRITLFADGTVQVEFFNLSTGGNTGEWRSARKLQDPNAWYHIVAAIDSSQSAVADRMKLYINGEQVTDWDLDNGSAFSQNTEVSGFNCSGQINHIGSYAYNNQAAGSSWCQLYLTEMYFIDDKQLAPTAFGEFNADTGVWVPIKYTESFTSNDYYLNFSDGSDTTATTLGKDYSGNGNNFTCNGQSVAAGPNNDSLLDSPTNNYATINGVWAADGALSTSNVTRQIRDGNLTVSGATNNSSDFICYASMEFPLTGKWYVEATVTTLGTAGGNEGGPLIGITDNTNGDSTLINSSSKMIRADGKVATTGNSGGAGNSQFTTSFGANIAQGDVWQLAYDADNRYVYFGNDDSWADGSGNYDETFANAQAHATQPTANVPQIFVFSAPYSSATGISYQFDFNFGQRPFAKTKPDGYKTLCTNNLPKPTIKLPKDYYDNLQYTGNNYQGTRAITGLNFNPGLLWSKARSIASAGQIYDSVRGFAANKELRPDITQAEGGEEGDKWGYFTALNNGFNFVTGSEGDPNGNASANVNNATYSTWCWKAGSSTVSDTSGGIDAQRSTDATSGFSIITYTGGGETSNVNVGTGLSSSIPLGMAIVKRRDSTSEFQVGHHGEHTNNFAYHMELNDTTTMSGSSPYFMASQSTTDGSKLYLTTGGVVDGADYVAWVWQEVEGYSKFGHYKGNGSAEGPFIYLGFKPAYLLIKNTETTNYWRIMDNTSNKYNPVNRGQYANDAAIEDTPVNWTCNYLCNGFKVKNDDGEMNGDGQDIMYAAFAESPFKYSIAE